MSVKYAILGLLADGPLHGYELKAAYEGELIPESQLNFGQVYTTLDRLDRDGLVAHDLVRQPVRPDKKVYELTRDGRKELREWLATPSRPELDLRNETFLKLMLARRLKGFDPLEVLSVERRGCIERLHEIEATRARADTQETPLQTVLVLELAAIKLGSFIKWLDRCEELLKQEAGRRR
jgi:DNA-binding PadR family transcriptional regulator